MNAEHRSIVSLEWEIYNALTVELGYVWNRTFETGLMEFSELRDVLEEEINERIKTWKN
jgi:hypothetical protein